MKTVVEHSHAKINLTLDILGRRPDGYHEVRMLMQTLTLADEVRISRSRSSGIFIYTNLSYLPTGPDNIAYKAAEAFFRSVGERSPAAEISLIKRIPVAAGLAGGSGNAAAVLRGLNRLYQAGLSEEALYSLALPLGADVPFCLREGAMLAEGIGERLTPVPSLPDCRVVLAKPRTGASTRTVYERYDREGPFPGPDTDAVLDSLSRGDVYGVAGGLCNVLEPVTSALCPQIGPMKARLLEEGAVGAVMSGSGPTVFGIFDRPEAAVSCAAALRRGYPEAAVFVERPFTPEHSE